MSVQFCLALLALCSLAAASDPDCKELIKPQENRTEVHGKWIFYASISESKEAGDKIKDLISSWIVISDAPGKQDLILHGADRMSEKCVYTSLNHTVSSNLSHVTFDYNGSTYNSSGRYLKTCPDCLLWEETLTNNQKGISFYLFTRTGSLEASHVETFKKQAACLNLKSDMYFPETTNLCPDAPDAKEEKE